MRTFIALALVACSSPSPTPQAKVDPAKGSAATTTSAATLTPGAELPEVALSGFDAADNAQPTVSSTLSGITVDGKLVAALQDGVVKGEELEGGALGLTITKLAAVADQLDRSKRIMLGFDKRIPYRTLIATLFTLQKSGHTQFGLLARAGAHVVMAPITLPEKPEPTSGPSSRTRGTDLASQLELAKNGNTTESILRKIQSAYLSGIKGCYKQALERDPAITGKLALTLTVDATGKTKRGRASGIAPALDACVTGLMEYWRFGAAKDPKGQTFTIVLVLQPDHEPVPEGSIAKRPALKLIVSLSKTDVRLWSFSRLEGTLDHPRFAAELLEKSALADLNRTLAEIVAQRFTTERQPEDRAIVLMADAATSMQMIADVIAALRATPDAKELFPDIQLAIGFE